MIVSDVAREQRGDIDELSALVDRFRLYFRFPAEMGVAVRGDLFVAATFISTGSRSAASSRE